MASRDSEAVSSIYLSGGLIRTAFPQDRCLPEAAWQGVRFRQEADSRGNSKQSYGIIMPTELTRTS
jgi:hypothetical protein